ncbi:hypothetical protein [Streptomyces poonensis]|nr:hypothetical protein [Streptomyces poonensis]
MHSVRTHRIGNGRTASASSADAIALTHSTLAPALAHFTRSNPS